MPFFACVQNSKKVSRTNSYGYQESSFEFKLPEQSSYQSFEQNLEYPDAIEQKFNFNPKEDKVFAFIDKILKTVLDKNKLDKLKELQLKLDILLANYRQLDEEKKYYYKQPINDLSCKLKLESMQVIEKLKLTFKGFDICEQAMPLELLHSRKDILANDILFLIRQGYINAQIISLFDLSLEQYEELSRKGLQRNKFETIKFKTILTFVDKINSLIKLTQSQGNGTNKEKINKAKRDILEELKGIGKEGKKAYFLLHPLLNYNSEASEFMQP